MQDTKLYEQILGLQSPWFVKRVDLKTESREVEVEVGVAPTVWACPECAARMHVHGSETRRWRHLDTCQFKTIVVADVPRVKCERHGTQSVSVPWAEKHSRFTMLFERFAIDVMQSCSVSAARELLGISWDEADGIKQRAVRRGLGRRIAKPIHRLCVDEKNFGRGQDYVTLVVGLDSGKAVVEHIADGRSQESLDGYWQSLSPAQRDAVQAVGMDMWQPFVASTRANVPNADEKIVHDCFHVIQQMNEAVNDVRKEEHRSLQARGIQTLSNSKQLWLYGFENVPARCADWFANLRSSKLRTARAWILKEMLRDFWTCRTREEGEDCFRQWYAWAIRSRLKPVKRVARMIKRRLGNVLTFFTHRLTSAAAEGMNNKIQGLIKKAFGYRSRTRFKTDVFFHCGGLDLYPAFSQ
jgi:transposase